jgi:hypothetical protein
MMVGAVPAQRSAPFACLNLHLICTKRFTTIGIWGETLDSKVLKQLADIKHPEESTKYLVREIMVNFVTLFGSAAIRFVEESPTSINHQPWAVEVVKTSFNVITEDTFFGRSDKEYRR